MFDLGKEKIDFNCPNCNRKHTVLLNDVSRRGSIHCGCGSNISLNDSNGSVKKGISDINSSLKKLEDAFKRFGR